jgi:hypothetical protein
MASSKKLFFPTLLLVGLLAGCGAVFVNEGSKNAYLAEGLRNPDKPPKPELSRASRLIGDFEDGSPSMNSHLFSSNEGGWLATSGTNVLGSFIAPGGANGTQKAAHLSGMIFDPGDFTYPALTLQGKFHTSGNYDASLFNGIRFYYKCPQSDKAHRRRFAIAVAPTVATSEGGTCLDQCGNHYGADLKQSDDWVKLDFKFNDLTREQGWGSAVTPPNLSDHLQEFIYLKWESGANNVKGTFNIDYWVDEVEFF